MGKASFLELNDCQVGGVPFQQATLDQILHEGILLQSKDPCHQVRSVLCCLSRLEVLSDLWPVGVAGHSDEEIRLVELLMAIASR